ncbi:hypothetical protein SIAM614_26501 [Stappia aggregata IAM 12614]|uniref:Uncharacterized protein n=1 Tax=Roseibium aggregatum (strain ATCC 25650 / DSM 13394 / JCM 20685 / NBRC 16684 / NCIMB 2208 / IAM 12614 / B1) TaxID=384765 RepID=A0P036_ROSAI|nr:hypothetical protein SIAM614_26501 [Stappia aggregata IAM 12614] [Roseibium aggregatum IAM 12614]
MPIGGKFGRLPAFVKIGWHIDRVRMPVRNRGVAL